jgi:RNA polymerase sigma factor (sigma-70 family)
MVIPPSIACAARAEERAQMVHSTRQRVAGHAHMRGNTCVVRSRSSVQPYVGIKPISRNVTAPDVDDLAAPSGIRRDAILRAVIDRGGRDRFATTRWSVVLAAGSDPSSLTAREALTTLCETYWYPLYAFLRGRGHSAADAEDLTQAFFARVLEKQVFQHADPARGRFRSFLLASLQHFAANAYDREMAGKRGGGAPILSLELERAEGRFQLEPSSDETPERTFDRRWALMLLDRVMSRLSAEAAQNNRSAQFETFKTYLTGDEPQVSYAAAANRLGISEGAVKVAVHRLRKSFRDLVRQEIAQTVSSPEDIQDELRHLWSAVGR